MKKSFSRRGFVLSWLAGLLAGALGRSQASAAAPAPASAPTSPDSATQDAAQMTLIGHSTVTYTASGLPNGLSLDPSAGMISGTVFPSGK